jgi:hypothetical protein
MDYRAHRDIDTIESREEKRQRGRGRQSDKEWRLIFKEKTLSVTYSLAGTINIVNYWQQKIFI